MKTYRDIIKGNTVILEKTPGLPDDTKAIVSIKVIDRIQEEETVKRQLELRQSDNTKALERKKKRLEGMDRNL